MRTFFGLAALILSSSACSASTPPPAASSDGSGAPAGSEPAPSSAAAPGSIPGSPDGSAPASSSAGGAPAAPRSTLGAVDTREDAHWIQADDYFIASRAFDKGWHSVYVAKMKEPPTDANKGEALFFVVKDGGEERSAHFYRTRPAAQADLVLGNVLICFDHNKQGKVYGAPRDKDNARPGAWWIARITDLSDLSKGYATLAGHYHCAPDALRALVK